MSQHKPFTVKMLYVITSGNIVVHFVASLLDFVDLCMAFIVIISERND
jgi:hypothetical protein